MIITIEQNVISKPRKETLNMSLYLNYKLTLNSGESFESDNGGYQGSVRDAFLAETPIAKVQKLTTIDQLKFYQKQLDDHRSFTVRLFGNFPNNLYTNFNYDSNYDGTVFTIDLDTNWNQTKIDDFLYLLDYTYRLEIDNNFNFMAIEYDAFSRAYIENDFNEDDANEPQTQYHAALRKRWFIEYFKGNLFLGFQLKNIKSFEFTID